MDVVEVSRLFWDLTEVRGTLRDGRVGGGEIHRSLLLLLSEMLLLL